MKSKMVTTGTALDFTKPISKVVNVEYVGQTSSGGLPRDIIKAMAMDAGKSLCAYIEVMFPEVWHGQNSGFKISMKHHVYNDIMALADLHDEAAIHKRLADNEAHRKQWVGAYRKMRRKKCEHGLREYECGLCDDKRRAKLVSGKPR